MKSRELKGKGDGLASASSGLNLTVGHCQMIVATQSIYDHISGFTSVFSCL